MKRKSFKVEIRLLLVIQLILLGNISVFAQNQNSYLSFENKEGDFCH